MKNLSLSLALSAFMLLAACATATPYQAANQTSRGYTDTQIEDNRWQVSFSGNALTDRKTVETYLLYRAAELTLQQGYDYFRVAQRETEADRTLVPTGFGADPFYSGFYCHYSFYGPRGRLRSYPRAYYDRRYYGRGYSSAFYDPFYRGYDYREIVRYEASAEIQFGRGEKPDAPEYFDAAQVSANLADDIIRPEI